MDPDWRSVNLPGGIHAFTGGEGSPVILVPGWPETAESFGDVFSILSMHHEVWALDPPGLGESAAPTEGYDTKAISQILKGSLAGSVREPYHLVGHDVGAWIAYAWAAQFPDSIKTLTLLDAAVPGLAAPQSFPLADGLNMKLWQFSFNRVPGLPEILTQGREKEFFNWLFDSKAKYPERVTQSKRDRYVECYSKPGGMSNGFAYYRALPTSSTQNVLFAKQKLLMPVLALGAETGMGKTMVAATVSLAVDVQGGDIEDCGHYMMEEQPEIIASKLLEFIGGAEAKIAKERSQLEKSS